MRLAVFSFISLLAAPVMLVASSPVIQADKVRSRALADANPERDITARELADIADAVVGMLRRRGSDANADQRIPSPPGRHSSVQTLHPSEGPGLASENTLDPPLSRRTPIGFTDDNVMLGRLSKVKEGIIQALGRGLTHNAPGIYPQPKFDTDEDIRWTLRDVAKAIEALVVQHSSNT